ncbi:hypothetical protein GPAL_2876 [Glaciecola pallidula DSM 14239 = ACAM 615]|uniref:Uncharacterized protein n=1 Tax=Brumicola pallidula DSM 14239 = ACAM 615 TaxID=1121922 RepID=K6ZH81_9ALTE|nr:hypothetical protein GPAL_2876 [Glaciecola pallidula DSM 14239 = ACAM 615]
MRLKLGNWSIDDQTLHCAGKSYSMLITTLITPEHNAKNMQLGGALLL